MLSLERKEPAKGAAVQVTSGPRAAAAPHPSSSDPPIVCLFVCGLAIERAGALIASVSGRALPICDKRRPRAARLMCRLMSLARACQASEISLGRHLLHELAAPRAQATPLIGRSLSRHSLSSYLPFAGSCPKNDGRPAALLARWAEKCRPQASVSSAPTPSDSRAKREGSERPESTIGSRGRGPGRRGRVRGGCIQGQKS